MRSSAKITIDNHKKRTRRLLIKLKEPLFNERDSISILEKSSRYYIEIEDKCIRVGHIGKGKRILEQSCLSNPDISKEKA